MANQRLARILDCSFGNFAIFIRTAIGPGDRASRMSTAPRTGVRNSRRRGQGDAPVADEFTRRRPALDSYISPPWGSYASLLEYQNSHLKSQMGVIAAKIKGYSAGEFGFRLQFVRRGNDTLS